MNYNFANLIDYEIGLIGLIIEFLFGSVIELGKGKNTEALNFRLVCRKFKQEFDRLVHLSLTFPIRIRYCPPSEISSIYMFGVFITEQDWRNIFGDKLSNLESSLEHLSINAGSIKYLPKFNCLKSISWEVIIGCYELLEGVPHNNLKITRYNFCDGSIERLTKLREIEITMSSTENKFIDKYLPPTIIRMTINMYSESVDVIDLSKFTSLKYLKIVEQLIEEYDEFYSDVRIKKKVYRLGGQLIKELILPPSLNELHSEVKIEKMNLHQCKKLEVIELKK